MEQITALLSESDIETLISTIELMTCQEKTIELRSEVINI